MVFSWLRHDMDFAFMRAAFKAGKNWGTHARLGFRVFQTDWPALLREYLESAGFRPPRAKTEK